jgi:anti-sigma B factor antagonist
MEFSCKFEEKNDHCVIHFTGNLIEKSQAIEMMDRFDDLISRDRKKFILDLANFGYMNSTGLNTLISILTKARKAGGEAVVSSVPGNVKSLLAITRLNSIFTVAESELEAEKMLAG